ncbi:MAG: beta-N-acetylhexosaminidase [Alphaproteobacteria bacterium]|nr:beta-N-acetylhexosaminidase [Alphaproteobacteria bacterium]
MARPKAVIFGCGGLELTSEEKAFFRSVSPLGFIMFARNCESPKQVAALTLAMRECIDRSRAPVLIDQEGGRVQRLSPPHWRDAPAAAVFGRLAAIDKDRAKDAVRLNARLLAAELLAIGIDVDCLPVLDIPAAGSHDIIGDRAYCDDPLVVAELGRAACEGLMAGGVTPVIKHIPGHGRARADSHKSLPRVDASRAALAETDFVPFQALRDMPWAMTAHVLYEQLDPTMAATLSKVVIEEVIRREIGFDGLLLTDDLSMGALAGSMADRTRLSLAAGCDVILHCNGDLTEMREIADECPELGAAGWERYERGTRLIGAAADFDVAAASAALADLLG